MASKHQHFIPLFLVSALTILSPNTVNAASYNFTMLESLGGAGSYALEINNDGVVVGGITTAQFASTIAASWHNGVLTQLPTNGKGGAVFGINNQGMMVGTVTTADEKSSQAATWSNGALTVFGNTISENYSIAYKINDTGKIVGGYVDDNNIFNSFTIENDQFQALPSLFGRGSTTYTSAINSSGTVVGQSNDAKSNIHATIWQNNLPTEPASQGNYSVANGINDAGEVVGTSHLGATIWRDGTPTQIDAAGRPSSAIDINNKGQIIGFADGIVTLWDKGNAIALSSLIDPAMLENWTIRNAVAINDNGDIIGQALERGGDPRTSFAFLLTLNIENPPPPDMSTVPLPASLPLMMTGLGALGVMIRRKN